MISARCVYVCCCWIPCEPYRRGAAAHSSSQLQARSWNTTVRCAVNPAPHFPNTVAGVCNCARWQRTVHQHTATDAPVEPVEPVETITPVHWRTNNTPSQSAGQLFYEKLALSRVFVHAYVRACSIAAASPLKSETQTTGSKLELS